MSLSKLFGAELPIIQAPMAGVQDSRLALAVARAGGLGSLPCAMLSTDQLELELRTITKATNSPINLNFFCHKPPKPNPTSEARWQELLQPYFTELGVDPNSLPVGPSRQPFGHEVADIIEAYAPRVISFHFGLPSHDLVNRVKSWGTTILSSATTVEEALWLEANGADFIIAQGVEAGGHRGMFLTDNLASQLGAASLLKSILKKVNTPVISAGGISSAIDVNKRLKEGAIAVQVGTSYLLCKEAKTSILHRDALQKNCRPQTTLTNVFSGRPARGIINRAIKELGPISNVAPEFPLAATAMTALRAKAEIKNSSDFTPLWSGENTQGCDAISAHDLTLRLASKL